MKQRPHLDNFKFKMYFLPEGQEYNINFETENRTLLKMLEFDQRFFHLLVSMWSDIREVKILENK